MANDHIREVTKKIRLIDANALMDTLKKRTSTAYSNELWGLMLAQDFVEDAPTVDAVEVADMREFAEDVVYQFGYYCQNGGRLHITHGGLSTLEWAFDILGWENPHPVPEFECEIDGCHEHATCGTPTDDGYKRMCGMHYRNHRAKMDGDGNA
jgi:hypothetical protein